MRICIENIGIVKKATVDLETITVIAGNNNTGKSTIGKSLYSSIIGINQFNMANLLRDKSRTLINEMEKIFRISNLDFDLFSEIRKIDKISRKYFLECKAYEEDGGADDGYEHDFYTYIEDSYRFDMKAALDTLFEKIYNSVESDPDEISKIKIISVNIYKQLEKSAQDISIKRSLIQDVFDDEFSGAINPALSNHEKGSISIEDKNQLPIYFEFEQNKIIADSLKMDVIRPLGSCIYIDNPFIVDNFSSGFRVARERFNHNITLEHAIRKGGLGNNNNNKFEFQFFSDEIQKILDEVIQGGVYQDGRKFQYQHVNFEKVLDIRSLSAGLKSFSIIQLILNSNMLSGCECIILDEPEIHLHPEWQIKYAEMIVLISKKLNIRILITSHSPYFIESIELFTQKHNYSKEVKFYKSLYDYCSNGTIIKDMTDNLVGLYQDMATPFQELEELREAIEDEEF